MPTFPGTAFLAPNLTTLSIHHCSNRRSRCDTRLASFPSLWFLSIDDCALLESFPENALPFHRQTLHGGAVIILGRCLKGCFCARLLRCWTMLMVQNLSCFQKVVFLQTCTNCRSPGAKHFDPYLIKSMASSGVLNSCTLPNSQR